MFFIQCIHYLLPNILCGKIEFIAVQIRLAKLDIKIQPSPSLSNTTDVLSLRPGSYLILKTDLK